MRQLPVLLVAAGLCAAAPVIFTDPIYVSGGGGAFWQSDGVVNSGSFGVDFHSVNTIIPLSVHYDEFGFGPGSFGTGAVFVPGQTTSFVPATLGSDSSFYFSYAIAPAGMGGFLRLFDIGGNLRAEAPLIGYHQVTLLRETLFPSGGFLREYGISISPTAPVPEPSGFILTGFALIGLPLVARRLTRHS